MRALERGEVRGTLGKVLWALGRRPRSEAEIRARFPAAVAALERLASRGRGAPREHRSAARAERARVSRRAGPRPRGGSARWPARRSASSSCSRWARRPRPRAPRLRCGVVEALCCARALARHDWRAARPARARARADGPPEGGAGRDRGGDRGTPGDAVPALRRDGQRQDGGLPARGRGGARQGQERDRARARDLPDASGGRSFPRALRRPRRGAAQRARRGRALRSVAADPRGPRADRDRRLPVFAPYTDLV
jgi:hypothetical protein